MSMTDPIADMLTRIRNAQTARQPSVSYAASKRKLAIAKVLEQEGYLGSVTAENVDGKDSHDARAQVLPGQARHRAHRAREPAGLRILQARGSAARRPGRLGLRDRVDVARRDDERAGRAKGHGGEVLCIVL
jgi:small subunit ribosomal protein S8